MTFCPTQKSKPTNPSPPPGHWAPTPLSCLSPAVLCSSRLALLLSSLPWGLRQEPPHLCLQVSEKTRTPSDSLEARALTFRVSAKATVLATPCRAAIPIRALPSPVSLTTCWTQRRSPGQCTAVYTSACLLLVSHQKAAPCGPAPPGPLCCCFSRTSESSWCLSGAGLGLFLKYCVCGMAQKVPRLCSVYHCGAPC